MYKLPDGSVVEKYEDVCPKCVGMEKGGTRDLNKCIGCVSARVEEVEGDTRLVTYPKNFERSGKL